MAKEYFEKIFPKKLRIYDKMKKHHSYKKACSIMTNKLFIIAW